MNQDQIDSGKSGKAGGKQLIDLNGVASPAVLAGIFGVSVANIYQYRQNGRLPPNSDATYRDCLNHHIVFLKGRAGGKVASLREAAELQKLQLDRVKTEKLWMEVKADKQELIDRQTLAGVFEPLFVQVRSQLNSFIRKHPEQEAELLKIMQSWGRIGETMERQAKEDLDAFIEAQMDYEPEIEDEEITEEEGDDEPLSQF